MKSGMNQPDGDAGGRLITPAIAVLCTVSFLAGAAMGLFNPLISTLMAQHHSGDVLIGFNSTVFFLAVMLVAPITAWLLRRFGVRLAMSLGLLLTAVSAAQIPLYDSVLPWFVLRAMMGLGVGLYMIAGQTGLNLLASEKNRALLSGLHALSFGIGLGVGPLIGSALYNHSPQMAFMAGAAMMLLGVPGVLALLPALKSEPPPSQAGLLRLISLPLHGVLAYGIAEATLMSLYPVFLLRQGFNISQIGVAFSVFVAGSILSTLPLTHLADRFGRTRVLQAVALVGVLATAGLVTAQQVWLVTTLSFVAGAAIGPVYAISLALMGQLIRDDQMATGSAMFTTAFSLGSMLAPLSAGLMMKYLGSQHIFSLTMVLFAILFLRIAFVSTSTSIKNSSS